MYFSASAILLNTFNGNGACIKKSNSLRLWLIFKISKQHKHFNYFPKLEIFIEQDFSTFDCF